MDDVIMCRVFLTSLKGEALNCFTCLPHFPIACFITLVECFGTKFAMSSPYHLTSIFLVKIRQGKRVFARLYEALWEGCP